MRFASAIRVTAHLTSETVQESPKIIEIEAELLISTSALERLIENFRVTLETVQVLSQHRFDEHFVGQLLQWLLQLPL